MKRENFESSMISLTLRDQFSAPQDKGFLRVKTISNPFVVPIQVQEFKLKLVKPEASKFTDRGS